MGYKPLAYDSLCRCHGQVTWDTMAYGHPATIFMLCLLMGILIDHNWPLFSGGEWPSPNMGASSNFWWHPAVAKNTNWWHIHTHPTIVLGRFQLAQAQPSRNRGILRGIVQGGVVQAFIVPGGVPCILSSNEKWKSWESVQNGNVHSSILGTLCISTYVFFWKKMGHVILIFPGLIRFVRHRDRGRFLWQQWKRFSMIQHQKHEEITKMGDFSHRILVLFSSFDQSDTGNNINSDCEQRVVKYWRI